MSDSTCSLRKTSYRVLFNKCKWVNIRYLSWEFTVHCEHDWTARSRYEWIWMNLINLSFIEKWRRDDKAFVHICLLLCIFKDCGDASDNFCFRLFSHYIICHPEHFRERQYKDIGNKRNAIHASFMSATCSNLQNSGLPVCLLECWGKGEGD